MTAAPAARLARIKVTDGYIYSGDGFYTPSSNTDCLKAPVGGVMVQHVRVTDGSVEKAGFRYSGGKLQWSSDLSTWNDFAVSVSGVTALNSLTGALSITAGTGVTITPASPNIQVSIGQSVATTAAVTFASLNPGIVFRKENSTDEGGSFNLESPNTDNYPTLYVDNFQGYVRFIGTKNAANHCPMQVWGKAGVAGLDVLAGYVEAAEGFLTESTSANAIQVTGAGGGIFADYLTADEFLKLTSKSAAPAAISGSYGGFAHKSGSAYWYWTGSAWAEANFAALLPSGTSGQTLRHDGTSWAASSVIFNNGTNVGIGTATPGSYKLSVLGGSVLISASDGISGVLALAGHGWVGSVDWVNLTLVAGTNSGNAGIYFQTEGSQRMSIGGNGAVVMTGASGAAGLTVTAGWMQCAGGFLTSGTAADIINAGSGGVTSRYLVLSAAAGTPNLSIQEGAAPALPSSGWSRLYMDSGTHKLMVSQNGAAAVGLLDRLTSINSQAGPSITLQGYTNEIAVSTASSNTIQVRLATNIEAQGTVRLVGGHLYLANNYSINFRDTGGYDRVAITRGSDNHLYIDNVDNNGDIYLRPANSRYVIIGQGSSSNAYLIPNTAGGTNSVGTTTYPWDEVNSATYKYGNTLLINSSGQFVGLGISMQSYACGASGFNCYSGGAWKYGRTVTLYDRDGNAMNFYGGILAS